MPHIRLVANKDIELAKIDAIKKDIGEAISILPGKSEHWLMVEVIPSSHLYFQGTDDPCCYYEVSYYGRIERDYLNSLSRKLTSIASYHLHIPAGRIYVDLRSTPDWAFEGELF